MTIPSLLMRGRTALAILCAGYLNSCSSPAPQPLQWRLNGHAMAAAADPRAVKTALEILRKGGHAVDAAIAAHAVLGLVEPQSSGIGGGAFMLVYQQNTGEIIAHDGRETAPKHMHANAFMQNGKPMPFNEAWQSGLSVGVPGIPALYRDAHEKYGTLPWDSLFNPAIALAEQGFIVSPRLAALLEKTALKTNLNANPDSAAYFYPNGKALQAGEKRRNPEYAKTLRTLAKYGAKPFYHGNIARKIVQAAQAAPNGGNLNMSDMDAYQIRQNNATCSPFQQYLVCSAPPPSSGAIAQGMILGLYDRLDTDQPLLAFIDAQRLAYADRDHYVADPEFVPVPEKLLLHPDYLDARAKERFQPDALPRSGDPGATLKQTPMRDKWGMDTSQTGSGTTHLSIVDMKGNAVSMTATIESAFGSSRMAGGFLLNNELTDFAFTPEKNGKPVANAPEGGKRPRSSMSPTIVLDQNNSFFMATGSPGGNSIIAYVAKTLLGVLDWNMDAQMAVNFPNIIARGKSVKIESSSETGREIADMLESHGYNLHRSNGEISGLHVIVARKNYYEGAADPRREGIALGISPQNYPARK